MQSFRINSLLGEKLTQTLTDAVLIVNIVHLIDSQSFLLIQLLLLCRQCKTSKNRF